MMSNKYLKSLSEIVEEVIENSLLFLAGGILHVDTGFEVVVLATSVARSLGHFELLNIQNNYFIMFEY